MKIDRETLASIGWGLILAIGSVVIAYSFYGAFVEGW